VKRSTLLLIGDPTSIIVAVVTAIAGIWFVSMALAGYFMRPLPLLVRLVLAIAGLLALVPAGAFPGAELTDIAGALVGMAMVAYEYFAGRAPAPETVR